MIQNPELDEDSSDEWEQIKNYVGGANKASKHPLQMEQERLNRRKPPHMDEGGTAGVSDDLLKLSQPAVAGVIAPGLGQPPPQALAQPAQTPPMAPTAPIASPVAQVPPSAQPAPVSAPTDASYDAQASKVMGGVTPEMLQALAQKFARPTAGQAVGMGVAGIGDAIASIGGREPGHMKNAMDMFQKNREMQMKVPEAMAAMGKEKYGLSQTLQEKDPNSLLSKYAQDAYGNLGKNIGINLSHASASLIADVTGKSVEAFKAEMESKMKGREFNLGEKSFENTARHERTEEGLAARTKQQEAAKALAGRGFWATAGSMIPFSANRAATEVLENQAVGSNNFAPDVTSYAQQHGITPEQAQAIKDKRTGGQ
jgi:hypothetical protein